MQEYQQRVVTEKEELDVKSKALSEFIGNNKKFDLLDPEEQERMREQCEAMWKYSEILGIRIAAFNMTHIGELKKLLVDAEVNRSMELSEQNNERWGGYIEGVKAAIYRLEMTAV